jgi:hypothetical protein
MVLNSVILIVHELVFNMCDSNMHGERIKNKDNIIVFIIIFITYSSIIYPQKIVEVCLILNFDDDENNTVVTPMQFISVQCTSVATS